jgi:EF hand
MKRSIISLLVVGLCAGTATAAVAQNVDKPGETSQGMATDQKGGMTTPSKDDQTTNPKNGKHDDGAAAFKKADKDNDGTLDRNEAKAMPQVAKNFDAIDADKDGTVSLDEVHTYMKARHDAAKNHEATKN